MTIRINNPGGGDCGFHAFAIGLIAIIQDEHRNGKQDTFDRCSKQGLNVELQNILTVDLHRLADNPRSADRLLNQFQMSLRHLTAESLKTDLLTAIATDDYVEQVVADDDKGAPTIEGTTLYVRYSELVNLKKENPSLKLGDPGNVNGIVLLPELYAPEELNWAASVATSDRDFMDAFRADIAKGNSSVILTANDNLRQKSTRWASHCELKELAKTLQVNFIVMGQPGGEIQEHLPTVTLNNEGNRHWTTQVSLPPQQTSQLAAPRTFPRSYESLLNNSYFKKFKKTHLTNQNRIDINKIDEAKGFLHGKGALNDDIIKTDEAFATRLQDAEVRLYQSTHK